MHLIVSHKPRHKTFFYYLLRLLELFLAFKDILSLYSNISLKTRQYFYWNAIYLLVYGELKNFEYFLISCLINNAGFIFMVLQCIFLNVFLADRILCLVIFRMIFQHVHKVLVDKLLELLYLLVCFLMRYLILSR